MILWVLICFLIGAGTALIPSNIKARSIPAVAGTPAPMCGQLRRRHNRQRRRRALQALRELLLRRSSFGSDLFSFEIRRSIILKRYDFSSPQTGT
jgi:hypothetical protein